MSFFKSILSKVGIGSATVETELFNTLFVPGQPVLDAAMELGFELSEVVCEPAPAMEVDRKAKGKFGQLSEMMGTDETMVNFLVQEKDLPRLTDKVNDFIEEYCA